MEKLVTFFVYALVAYFLFWVATTIFMAIWPILLVFALGWIILKGYGWSMTAYDVWSDVRAKAADRASKRAESNLKRAEAEEKLNELKNKQAS